MMNRWVEKRVRRPKESAGGPGRAESNNESRWPRESARGPGIEESNRKRRRPRESAGGLERVPEA